MQEVEIDRGPAADDADRLLAIVAEGHDLTVEELRTKRPSRRGIFGRRVVAICLRELGYSYIEMGDALGLNHTTAIRLCKGYGGTFRASPAVEVDVAKARAEASTIVATIPKRPQEEARCPSAFRRIPDKGRPAFEEAVEAYRTLPHPDGFETWLGYCRAAFPLTWWKQAAMFPKINAEIPEPDQGGVR
jgi:hypothetical protein